MRIMPNVWREPRSSVNDCVVVLDCASPLDQRVLVPAASIACAGTSPPAVDEAVATQPVRGSTATLLALKVTECSPVESLPAICHTSLMTPVAVEANSTVSVTV